MKTEPGIDTLLDLNGSILDQGNGYWIKLEARRVAPSVGVPHGIRYSLTLHEPNGNRILGYDNAHPVKPPQKFRFAGRVIAFDHRHGGAGDKGLPYEFKDAHQLLSDFFSDVDRVLRDMNVNKP